MKKERNANIDLLRIIAMLMIVAHHYTSFGFFDEELYASRNKLFVDLIGNWGHVGVDAFAMIAGYYMVGARLRIKKLFSLMGSLWFYSLGFLLVFTLTGKVQPDRAVLLPAFFPLLRSEYWFISYYALMLLLTPFFNALLRALSRREHAALCVFLFTLCCLLPMLAGISFASGQLPLFTVLYLTGAYCRLYARFDDALARRNGRLALGFLALCAALMLGIDLLGFRAGSMALLRKSTLPLETYSPLAFFAALLLLLRFCGRKPRQNRFLSGVGGLTLGVYLFHANPLFNAVIWQEPFRTASFTDSPLLPLHALAVISLIFTAGCLVEWLRQKTLAPLWDRGIDLLLPHLARLWTAISALFLRLLDWLLGTSV